MKSVKLIFLGVASFVLPLIFYFQSVEISDLNQKRLQGKADSARVVKIADSVARELNYAFTLSRVRDSLGLTLAINQKEIEFDHRVIEMYKSFSNRPTSIEARVTIPSQGNNTIVTKPTPETVVNPYLSVIQGLKERIKADSISRESVTKSVVNRVTDSLSRVYGSKTVTLDSIASAIRQSTQVRNLANRSLNRKDKRRLDSIIRNSVLEYFKIRLP